MPLFMDVHDDMPDLSKADLEHAHEEDLRLQGDWDVTFLKYWYDPEKGKIFCLSEAPSADAPLAVHKAAGHPAAEVYQVDEFE